MSRGLCFALLVLLISLTYLYTASGLAITDDGDALYANIARQMAKSGDYVTPYADGVRFLDKPPMMYWLMATSFRMFGFNEFTARLPSALAVLGIGVLLFLFGIRAGSYSSGVIAGLATALCVGTFLFTRVVFPDIVFVFFLTLSLYAFLEWYSNESNSLVPALLFYASLAAAVLTKSLIGLVFPAATIGLFLFGARDFSRLRRCHFWKGLLLFLALTLPWHVLAVQRNPGFLWHFFVNEQFLRFVGKRQPVDYESISLLIFWLLVLLWLFPWSAFFPAIRHLLHRPDRHGIRNSPALWLCVSWAVVVLIFFSMSTRIEHYSMPIFPPLALLIALALTPERLPDQIADNKRRRSVARSFVFLGLLGGIMAVLLIAAGVWGGLFSGKSLSSVAGGRLHAYQYYFAPLFEMPPQILDRLKIPLVGTLAALAAGLLGAWWVNRQGMRMEAVFLLSLMTTAFCFFTFQSFGICEEVLSSKQFGQELNRLYRAGDSVIVAGDYEIANSMSFYMPVDLEIYGGTAAVLQWGLRFPDAPARILSRAQLEQRWNGPQRTFVLVTDDRINSLGLSHQTIIMRSAGRTLLSNQTPR